MADPGETAVTIPPRPETVGPEEEGEGPGNFQSWEEEAEETMAEEGEEGEASRLAEDRPAPPEERRGFLAAVVVGAGQEITRAPRPM